MNKRFIIFLLIIIIVLSSVIVTSYIITKNNNINVDIYEQENNIQNSIENNIIDEDQIVSFDENNYEQININSVLAKKIYDFVPKYFQAITNKMSNEYILYSAISRLEEEDEISYDFSESETEFPRYKFDIVEEKAKEIFGENIELEKKDGSNLSIIYNEEDDTYSKYPMGFEGAEEYQVIKELKENETEYILTLYALNIEYSIEDLNSIFIATKDTFKLYENQEVDENKIELSKKEYLINGIDIDATYIANLYKDELPLIEYEIKKLDDRGTKYFVENIKLITD